MLIILFARRVYNSDNIPLKFQLHKAFNSLFNSFKKKKNMYCIPKTAILSNYLQLPGNEGRSYVNRFVGAATNPFLPQKFRQEHLGIYR